MPIPTPHQKVAAAVLSNIAEAIDEIAYTEAGECDQQDVLNACAALLLLAGRISRRSLYLRHGLPVPYKSADEDESF
jgi:hypothetical protein